MQTQSITSPRTDGTLVVGIDFSESCERALQNAVTLAEHGPGQLDLELVHVFEWPGAAEQAASAEPLPKAEEPQAKPTDLAAHSQASLQRLAQLCSTVVGDRVSAKIRVLVGDPAARLLAVAERVNASLIVLGELGRTLQPRSELGSTAERVRTSSNVPVLLVP